MRRPARRLAAVIVVVSVSKGTVLAQEHLTLQTDFLFYGDNTEFRNPFREGETILGSSVRAALHIDVNDRVRIAAGVFANERFGSDRAFELVRPVVALIVRGHRSAFVLGTLPPPPIDSPSGPDRMGPHGLLPPVQRETLAFDRPYEAGVQWTFAGPALQHAMWIDWQRVNTAAHRERFDAGAVGDFRVARYLSVPFQVHIVHQGGQLFASGPVADSVALASGVRVRGRVRSLDAISIETYALASRFVPDRSKPGRSRDGLGFFGRASAERAAWRGHIIFWRGCDFVTEEGDRNYLSIRRNGTRYRGTRDYAEAGFTRRFSPAAGVRIEASARLHRIENYYEYSYRIIAVTSLAWRIR